MIFIPATRAILARKMFVYGFHIYTKDIRLHAITENLFVNLIKKKKERKIRKKYKLNSIYFIGR